MVKLDKKKREQYKKIMLDALHAGKKEEFRNTFLELHPSDQLDIFIKLGRDARKRGYSYLRPEEFADIFGGLNVRNQKLFFLELDEDYSVSMFNQMFTDDVVNFLTEINSERSEKILHHMDKDKAQKVRGLLSYAPETAGAIMTKELISISSADIVSNVLDKLRSDAPNAEIIYYFNVVNETETIINDITLYVLIITLIEVL